MGHLEQIGLSLLAGEKALRFQRFQNGDEIDGLGFHHLLAHHPVNGLMLGQIKIIGAQDVRHLVDAFGIHQNSAQNRLLRLQAVGQVQPVVIRRLSHRPHIPFLNIPAVILALSLRRP